MADSTFTTHHVSLESDRPAAEVVQALEAAVGRLDPAVMGLLAQVPPRVDDFRKSLREMAGASGLMVFNTRDVGPLLRLAGQNKVVRQFTIGNPLTALEMVRHNPAVGLYAPVRFLVYQDHQGHTRLDYDRPSSLVAPLGDEAIDAVALELDARIRAVVTAATGGGTVTTRRSSGE